MNTPAVSYGFYEPISIEQIRARTKVRLQLKEITDYDAEIDTFINEAGASLGSMHTFIKKNCKLEINDQGEACLPKGFKKFLGVRLLSAVSEAPTVPPASVNSIYTSQSPLYLGDQVYLERTFLDDCREEFGQNQNVNNFQGVVEIIGNTIRFPLPCESTHAILSYQGYAVNEKDNCILIMHAGYERCFSEYAVALMLRTYWQIRAEDRGREREIERAMGEYIEQRKKIISEGFATSFEQNKFTIKRVLHSLLQNQNNPDIL